MKLNEVFAKKTYRGYRRPVNYLFRSFDESRKFFRWLDPFIEYPYLDGESRNPKDFDVQHEEIVAAFHLAPRSVESEYEHDYILAQRGSQLWMIDRETFEVYKVNKPVDEIHQWLDTNDITVTTENIYNKNATRA